MESLLGHGQQPENDEESFVIGTVGRLRVAAPGLGGLAVHEEIELHAGQTAPQLEPGVQVL